MGYLFLSNVGKQRPSYSVEYPRRREFSSVNEKSLGRDYEGNVNFETLTETREAYTEFQM
jgi:hypothetical protein